MTKIIRNRKIILPIGMIAAVLAIGIMAAVYYLSPANYLSLDVNPSIELQTNRLNQVVSVNPVNEDAQQILAGYELTDRNLETVIKDIVDRMIVNGYITSDLDNEILISTEDKSTTTTLADTVNNIITAYLKEKQLAASTILQTVNATDEELQASHANNISVGKMRLIQSLIANNSALTVEELSGMRISDLLALSTDKNSTMDAAAEVPGVTEDLGEADNEAAYQDNEDTDDNDDQGINEEADDQGSKEDAFEEDNDNEETYEGKDQSKYEDSEEDSDKGYHEDADEDNDQNDIENDENDGNHISKYSIKKEDQEDNHNSDAAYISENREDNEDSEDAYEIEGNDDNDDEDGTASWSNNEDRHDNEDESGNGYSDNNEDED